MSDIKFALVILGLAALVAMVNLYRAYRRGRVKYELKKIGNTAKGLAWLVVSIYMVLLYLLVLPGIASRALEFLLRNGYNPPDLGYYLIGSIPFVSLLVVLGLVVWINIKGAQPWLKYSQQEQEWRDLETKKLKDFLRKYFGERVANIVK